MKKGFTLVELLCVIIIIAVVSGIVFPIVVSNINRSKDELLKVQIKDIEGAAKKWALANLDKLDKYHVNDVYVSIQYLKDMNFLDKDFLLNPKTKESMDEDCVLISYDFDSKQYVYEYKEADCKNNNFNPAGDNPYIVYKTGTEDPVTTNAKTPFYQVLLNNNTIKADGDGTDSGLYDIGDAYVFRGASVNNYVTYAGATWRIMSINKEDYSMKLIKASGDSTGIWGNTADFENGFTYSLIGLLTGTSIGDGSPVLLKTEWYNGIVPGTYTTYGEISTALSATKINKEIGLISLTDYALASVSCGDNIVDGSCYTNNYLSTLFNGKTVWTMNSNGEQVWYINNQGKMYLSNASTIYTFYPVIQVPVSVYQTSSGTQTGSSTTAYQITSSYNNANENN